MKLAQAYFTLGVCIADDAPETARRLRDFRDWELLARIASGSLVAPALYPALRRKSLLSLLPPDFADYLKTLNELNAQRNADLMGELDRALKLLNEAGIVPGLLKGAASLAAGLYEDPGERVLGDLDVLVPPHAFPEAERCLRAEGYYAAPSAHPEIPSQHELALAHPGRRGVIELHWHIVNPGRGLGTMAQLEATLDPAWREITRGPARCRIPDPALHFAHRFVHDMVHDPGYLRGWLGMRAMYEAYRIEQRTPALPWRELEAAMKENGVWREWQVYRQALERHFPSLPRRAQWTLRSTLWNVRFRLHQQWPGLYEANRRIFQVVRGFLPARWLRNRGW